MRTATLTDVRKHLAKAIHQVNDDHAPPASGLAAVTANIDWCTASKMKGSMSRPAVITIDRGLRLRGTFDVRPFI